MMGAALAADAAVPCVYADAWCPAHGVRDDENKFAGGGRDAPLCLAPVPRGQARHTTGSSPQSVAAAGGPNSWDVRGVWWLLGAARLDRSYRYRR
jgi:hypothetical protein